MFLHPLLETLQLVPGEGESQCRSSSLLHPLPCTFRELAHRSVAFGKDGFLPLPHWEEGQADFHLRNREVGLGHRKQEEVAWSCPELQAVRFK